MSSVFFDLVDAGKQFEGLDFLLFKHFPLVKLLNQLLLLPGL